MSDLDEIAGRLAVVRKAIDDACANAGRDPTAVTLVAVSKGHGEAAIAAALAAGQRAFGENYAQEFLSKIECFESKSQALEWHFIGRVQRNKAATIARAHVIHGIGAKRHLEALGAFATTSGAPIGTALLQLNVGAEDQKNGFSFSELHREMKSLATTPGIRVRGLMALPPDEADPRQYFRKTREFRDELQQISGVALPELSMGMSGDFTTAIAEGSTMVRVGTAIFGPRQAKAT